MFDSTCSATWRSETQFGIGVGWYNLLKIVFSLYIASHVTRSDKVQELPDHIFGRSTEGGCSGVLLYLLVSDSLVDRSETALLGNSGVHIAVK